MSVTEAIRAGATRAWLRDHTVLVAAGALIVVQLGYRAWATYGSWYHYDDFDLMARMSGAGPSPSAAIEPYLGHVMPGGMYLSWFADAVAPYDFRVTATLLLVLQAGAAVALLWMLVRMFGARPGILPPLALYLFWAITTPVAIWWAAGVTQLPWHIALFAGLGTHATYLRTRELRYALMTVGWSLFGFAFSERTALLFAAAGFLSLAYFARGTLGVRAVSVLRGYAQGCTLYAVTLAAYVAAYVAFALDLSPSDVLDDGLDQVVWNMVGQGYLPALVGGPVRWRFLDQSAFPDPGSALRWAAVAVVALVVWEIRRARTRSLRAWLLPAGFLAVDALFVLAGPATYLGTEAGLDYRHQGELGAVTAVALALAVLPLRGAVEPVEVRRASELLDHPRRVTLAVAATVALAVVSSTGFTRHWQTHDPAQAYFDTLLTALRESPGVVALDDTTVPVVVTGAYAYPDNTLSHLLRAYPDLVSFPRAVTDGVSTVTDDGQVVATVVTPLEAAPPGPDSACGYRVAERSRSISLDLTGVVVPPDTRQHARAWVRIGYLATGPSPVTVRISGETIGATIVGGLHALYLRTDLVADTATQQRVSEVTVSGLQGGTALCTNDVTAGPLAPVGTGTQGAP